MSEFYGVLQGNRGETTRGGSKKSGIQAALNSWQNRVRVNLYHPRDDEKKDFVGLRVERYTTGETLASWVGTPEALAALLNDAITRRD